MCVHLVEKKKGQKQSNRLKPEAGNLATRHAIAKHVITGQEKG